MLNVIDVIRVLGMLGVSCIGTFLVLALIDDVLDLWRHKWLGWIEFITLVVGIISLLVTVILLIGSIRITL